LRSDLVDVSTAETKRVIKFGHASPLRPPPPRLLPSWQRLYGNSPHPTEDESKLVMEESQLLVSNLGRESLRRSNVLLDHNSLKLLGILQESLVS
jgi:hypothetical protein